MEKFEEIITKYVQIGMKENNIEYAIDAVKYGTERHLIIENLTSNFRKESKENTEQLLTEIIEIVKGRKKKPNVNQNYSARQQKIYEDYDQLSNEKLQEYVDNAFKYDDSVIGVIKDILIERHVMEGEKQMYDELPEKKQRHGCVTAWLVFTIVANALTSVIYLVSGGQFLTYVSKEFRMPLTLILILAGGLNVYFASQLMNWKKSGFNGIAFTAGIMFFINLCMNVSFLMSLLGLAGIFILYLILQIKQDGISAWEQLE